MSWLQVSLAADAARAEAVSAVLESLGALAVTTAPCGTGPVLEPAPGALPLADRNRITGLFEGAADGAALCAALSRALGDAVGEPVVSVLEDADWEQAWRQRAVAREFGTGFWVLPGDAPEPAGARAVLRLEPGLAFGTGGHPTTALCLDWLAGQDLAGRTVIDYGCGSGILAIAAALLGARAVHAVDHDPQALAATRDNAARNGVASCVRVAHASQLADVEADVLVANILANALHDLAPRFTALVRAGGELALSGILDEQAQALAQRYHDAFALVMPRRDRDWLLLCGRRRD